MNRASVGRWLRGQRSGGPDVTAAGVALGVLSGVPDAVKVAKGAVRLISLFPGRTGSIGQVLERWAAQTPDAKAVIFEGRVWSYGEFNAWANRIAAALRAGGVRQGDAVALFQDSGPELLACVAGVVKLGAVAAMVPPVQRGDVLRHSLKVVKPKAIVASAGLLGAIAQLSSEGTPQGASQNAREVTLPAVDLADAAESGRPSADQNANAKGEATPVFSRGGFSDASFPVTRWSTGGVAPGWRSLGDESSQFDGSNPPETRHVQMKAPAFHIFTSGTTGLPKASVMSHYRWLRSMTGLGQLAMRLDASDVLFCPLPLHHNNALTVSWGAVLASGAALALTRKFSASKFWDEVRACDATAFSYIGELCRYLLAQPRSGKDRWHRVRVMIGNGLRAELWDSFQARFGVERVSEFYGASECNLVFINAFGLKRTAGFTPLSYAIVAYDAGADQVRRGADGFFCRVGNGEVGLLLSEVTARSPFDGYTDANASEAKVFRNVFKRGDCWFNTGDLVRDQGLRHIQFVDRVGDTFRWKGENVATTEVEAALSRVPGVEEAVVYGVQVPKAEGRAGMAALTVGAGFDLGVLAHTVQQALPAYAVPLFLRLRSQQAAVTQTFKFQKAGLKAEGFDPSRVQEPLYALVARSWVPLDAALFEQVQRGEIRW